MSISSYDDGPAPAVAVRPGRQHVSEVVTAALEELELRNEYGVSGFRTGIASLDEKLLRGMQPGRVGVVAGETKGGKTAFLGQLVVALGAQGVPTLLGSFEDEREDTVMRYLANMTRGDIGQIRDGFRTDSYHTAIPQTLLRGAERLAQLDIEMIARSAPMEGLGREIADWSKSIRERGFEFGAVIIDQLSHIPYSDRELWSRMFAGTGYPMPPKHDDHVNSLQWIIKIFQVIAKRHNLLIIVAHQLNEAHGHEKPGVSSMRYSRGIVHEADFVLMPWRPKKLPVSPAEGGKNAFASFGEAKYEPNVDGRSWIVCPAGRQVEAFEVEVRWIGAQQRFADLTDVGTDSWRAPKAPSPKAMEGMAKLAALRAKRVAAIDGLTAAANGVAEVEGPELLAVEPAPPLDVYDDVPLPEDPF